MASSSFFVFTWLISVLLLTPYCNPYPVNPFGIRINGERVDQQLPAHSSRDFEVVTVRRAVMADNGNNSDDGGSLRACKQSGLCPEGIANIVAGLTAIFLLGVFACGLWHWEVQSERKTRIKNALERNKIIDRQMEEEKKKREMRVEKFIAQSSQENRTHETSNEEGADESDPQSIQQSNEEVMRRLQEVTSDSDLSSDEKKELLSRESKAGSSSDRVTVVAEVSN